MGDAELKLIVEACRSSFLDRVPLTALPASDIRWDRLLALSRRHRMQGLVWEGLQSVAGQIPEGVATHLRDDAAEVIRANLQTAAETARLLGRFKDAGVDLLFLKGLALGALAYRNPYLKMGWDIDLLVSVTQLDRACRLLRSAGYTPVIPAASNEQQLAEWHEVRKESVWRRADGAFYIDLHSRLSDNPALLGQVGMASPRQFVALGEGIEIPTLATDELFAYLAVHGASSCWFRLKWVADFAGFLSTKSEMEVERLYDCSQRLGAGRAAAQALLLVESRFGIELAPRFRLKLDADPVNRWLANSALREIHSPVEPTERRMGTLMIHLTQLAMMPGASFAISEARRQFREVTTAPSADHQVTGWT